MWSWWLIQYTMYKWSMSLRKLQNNDNKNMDTYIRAPPIIHIKIWRNHKQGTSRPPLNNYGTERDKVMLFRLWQNGWVRFSDGSCYQKKLTYLMFPGWGQSNYGVTIKQAEIGYDHSSKDPHKFEWILNFVSRYAKTNFMFLNDIQLNSC